MPPHMSVHVDTDTHYRHIHSKEERLNHKGEVILTIQQILVIIECPYGILQEK